MTSFNNWLSGEGARVVDAMRAERARHKYRHKYRDGVPACTCGWNEGRFSEWLVHVESEVLRSALSLTTTCATCGGTGEGGPWIHGHLDCPDCKGGTVPGESVLVVREQLEPIGWLEPLDRKAIPTLHAKLHSDFVPAYRLRPLEKEDET